MSLASRAGVSPMMQRRTLAIMGDGGFWHNGLLTGVQAALFNGDDAVLVIMKNGYTSATGTQDILNTPDDEAKAEAERNASLHQSLAHKNQTIEPRSRAWACSGCAWCTPTRWTRCAHAAGGADRPSAA
jgi:indolepyruvate ferredoxin oxidoreductase alpha subunit